jgi:LL-diaminopimelate aminotransferase
MTGWRIGFAVGNARAVEGLAKVKENLDSGVFRAIQVAGLIGLQQFDQISKKIRKIYKARRDYFLSHTQGIFEFPSFDATFYAWARVPGKIDSTGFAAKLIERAGIIAVPGLGFGKYGEGYIRFSLTLPEDRLKIAVDRLCKFSREVR